MGKNEKMPDAEGSAGLTTRAKMGWAIGEFAIAAHMAVISIYLLFYLTNVHHFPASIAGTLILIPRLWNIVTDPLMGGVSDRVKSRWGRRRPFLLAGSLLWGGSFALMFAMPVSLTLAGKSLWFLITYLLVNTALSLYHVPYSAMAAEMTRDPDERLSLIGWKEMAARSSVLATVLASPLIVQLAPDPPTGHRWMGCAVGGLIAISGLTAFFTTRHAPAVAFQPQTMNWREQLRTFRANRPLFRLSAAYLLTSAVDAFYSAMFIYFVTIVLREKAGLTGILYPIGSLAAILCTPLWSRLGSRIGKRRTCLVAFALLAAFFLLSLGVPSLGRTAMFPFMAMLGAAIAGMFLLPSAMVPDTVEYDEHVSGMRREGAIYGAWIFTQQSGMALGAFLVGIYLDLSRHIAGLEEPAAIKLGFALVPATLLGAAMIIVRTYRIDADARDASPSITTATLPGPAR